LNNVVSRLHSFKGILRIALCYSKRH